MTTEIMDHRSRQVVRHTVSIAMPHTVIKALKQHRNLSLWSFTIYLSNNTQEAQGLGALLDKMADNDHIKLDNIEM